MAIPGDVQAALDRLVQYNSNPVGDANPYGLANYGNVINFPLALTDIEAVAVWFGSTGGLPGPDGREIQLQKSATHLQWRYVGDAGWTDIVALADLTGPKGDDGEPGTTDYNLLSNLPTLGTAADKNVANLTEAVSAVPGAIMDAEMTRHHVVAGLAPVRVSAGAALTIELSDNNTIIDHSNATAVACVLPNDLPVGFGTTVIQAGAGKISFSASSGATIRSEEGLTQTRTINSAAALTVISNDGGSAAVYYLSGGLQ
ncbi:hypothetical protein [Rhizobium rhizoryzae]|uniref:DUF2793 domain-containing protein n=1 Tax=Rhizobium rhizoryzae TaxID=451876 RepID=A0A7W6LMM5_9HYPH|nr:hypothetical protein [Rhizobium rhizoryzae]MBB4146017.1 hypothetical protein [Rhizobium rhizoryzae]